MKNAEKSGYAVGAFNVYNLEGIEAVIAAAEAEESPAILQVRNSLLVRMFSLSVYGENYAIYHVGCPLIPLFTRVRYDRTSK